MNQINITRQLLFKQKKIRIHFNAICLSNLFTKSKETYLYKNMFYTCWNLLLRTHIVESKRIALLLKKKTIKHLKLSSVNQTLTLKTLTNTSNVVQMFYSFFFWTFFAGATNSLFKKNKTAITNVFNKPVINYRKLTHPLNKMYVRSYKVLSRAEPFNVAKPVLSYLTDLNIHKEHPYVQNFKTYKQLSILMYCLFNDSLMYSNKRYLNRTTKAVKGAKHISKTSKAAFTVNQFLSNLLVT